MAQLRDTLIQGSARVTDTLYSNKININDILTAKKLVISSTTAEEHIQFSRTDNVNYVLFPNNTTSGIAIGYGVGTAYCPLIVTKSSVYPGGTTSTISLGATNNRWNGVYSSTGNFSGTVTVDRLSTNIFLDFRRSDGPSYIMLPDSKDLIINNGSTNGTAYANLQIGKTGITSAYGGALGSSTYPWGKIYIKGYQYLYANNTRYPLDTFLYNGSGTQVGEFWYDIGNATNVTGGTYYWRQYSPKATPDTGTSGFHETFYLPSVTAARTDNGSYGIITTKNLSNITTVGTVTSGTWNGTTIAVANGGTGVTSFTNDCVVVSTGTTQTLVNRGLKVIGGTTENVAIQAYTSAKTLAIQSPGGAANINVTTATNSGTGILYLQSGSTIYINKPSTASIIFTTGGADTSHENGRFNPSGMFHIGEGGGQSTHKLYVNGDSCFNGKIAFGAQASNAITEKASIAYNSTSKTIDSKFPWNKVISGSGTAGVTYNATGPVNGVPALWKFNCGIATPTNGDTITIEIPVAGHDSGVFVSTDNGTTYRPVSVSGTSRLTAHYPVGHFITLTFDADGTTNSLYPIAGGTTRYNSNTTQIPGKGCWRVVNYYDSGFNEWNLRQYTLKAVNAVTSGHIIGGTDSGYSNIDSGVAFDIRYAVLYAGSNLAAGSTGSNNFIHHYSINIKNSSGTNITLTTYKNVYIKGTISGHLFTPITGGSPYVSDITTTDDGYVYYYIGRCYSSNNAFTFDATGKSIYWYKNGAIQPYNALSNVSNNANLNSANGTIGDIIYWSAANTPARLAKGDAGKFLKMGSNNVPVWGEGSEVTLNGTATTTPSFYAPTGAGSNGQFLKTTGSGAPSWSNLPTASTTSAGIIQIGTGALNAAAGDHTHDYLPLIGGTVSGQITSSAVVGGATEIASTHCGALYVNTATSAASGEYFQSFLGCKTSSGAWSIAAASAANDLYFIYGTDANHTNSTNTVGKIKFGYDGKVYNAVWNDYAEYRKQFYEIEPGRVIKDTDYGYVVLAEDRLIPGAQVVSDTFGFAIGQAADSKTPVAVSGRALVYTYQDRGKYHAGDAVCSAPNGTVDLMTREEIQKYPDAIIGIVSEIPNYTIWGAENIPVNGRIWIKVR